MDAINSVQFSNHTGYPAGVRGQVLDDAQLQQLLDGLDTNNINHYSHIINGYIGSKSFLTKLGEVVSHLKSVNPSLIYVCDPVMGDTGPGLYVPQVHPVMIWYTHGVADLYFALRTCCLSTKTPSCHWQMSVCLTSLRLSCSLGRK